MNQSKLSFFVRSYWDYYLELEEEFINTKKYVAFEKANGKTYSLEYLKLMQAVCSEIDNAAKFVASSLDHSFKVDKYTNIQKWGYVLQNELPQILKQKVVFNHDTVIFPWSNWMYEMYRDKKKALRYRLKDKTKTPEWWSAYNSVKHQRSMVIDNGKTNYSKANLYNLEQCFAALYVLETEYMCTLPEEQQPSEIGKSRLFQAYYEQWDDIIY